MNVCAIDSVGKNGMIEENFKKSKQEAGSVEILLYLAKEI